MIVLFRTDASHRIGTGHVVRCLTLARKLREIGVRCLFVCRDHDGNRVSLIREWGFDVVPLPRAAGEEGLSRGTTSHGHWLGVDWKKDAEQTIAAIGNQRLDWIVVDHYAVDYMWEEMLRPHCKRIMVIDDLADRRHDCDLLLDQNLVPDYGVRYNSLVPESCARLLGPDYCLLQPEYAELQQGTRSRAGNVSRILVYFGGADLFNMTALVVEALADVECRSFAVDVVSNSASVHAGIVRSLAARFSWVKLHTDLTTLAPLMLAADLAIGAGGTTLWERCCMALPSIVVTVADNQIPGVSAANTRGALWWLGNAPTVSGRDITEFVGRLLANPAEIRRCSISCRDIVDGLGADRVLDNLMLNELSVLRARPACSDDESLLLRWANDCAVRANGFNPATITAGEHRSWFYGRLARPERTQIYIVVTPRNVPVGQVRFERDQCEWEVHYSVAAEARRRGLGVVILREAMRMHRETVGDAVVKARVKTGNYASRKVFEKLGFATVEHNDLQVVYVGCL